MKIDFEQIGKRTYRIEGFSVGFALGASAMAATTILVRYLALIHFMGWK